MFKGKFCIKVVHNLAHLMTTRAPLPLSSSAKLGASHDSDA